MEGARSVEKSGGFYAFPRLFTPAAAGTGSVWDGGLKGEDRLEEECIPIRGGVSEEAEEDQRYCSACVREQQEECECNREAGDRVCRE